MPVERVFLGWDGPGLHQAADFLRRRYATALSFDLGRVLIVTPSRRAGRRLLEILADQPVGATPELPAIHGPLIPPRIITVGDLPEYLYTPAQPVADDLCSLLARVQSLRGAPADVLARIVKQPPDPDDLPSWTLLAQDLGRLHDDLAAEHLRCADVAPLCSARFDFTDEDRWEALALLQDSYERTLAAAGFQDRHTARFQAISNAQALRACGPSGTSDTSGAPACDVIILATADLSRVVREMLGQLDGSVTALIHAPPQDADLFDALGCLLVERWVDRHIDLDRHQVHVADRPRDQALEAVRLVRSVVPADSFAPDQVTIGLGDDTLAPALSRSLDLAGIPARSALGRPLSQSRPVTLLAALARFLASRRYDDLAPLLRHPDIESYLIAHLPRPPAASWLETLDRFLTDHLALTIDQAFPGDPGARAVSSLSAALTDLAPGHPGRHLPLPAWSEPIAQVLRAVYGSRSLSRDHADDLQLIHALELIAAALRGQAVLPGGSGGAGVSGGAGTSGGPGDNGLAPAMTFSQAVAFTLARLAGATIPPEGGPPAVEVLGWLELQLDDAPLLIVTGLNEGSVPQSVTSDAFLPDHVRSVLGLLDNRRRLARDVMMLSAIRASRPQVHLITGRRGAQDDPLIPSRLLLARPAAELPAWIADLTGSSPQSPGHPWPGSGSTAMDTPPTPDNPSRFHIPPPAPLAHPLTTLRVTAFRDYLACPYRFYLKHVLRLETLSDHSREMDALAFGVLAHRVLQDFARGELAAATDAEAIAAALSAQLDAAVAHQFGRRPPAPVLIQREQLRYRLADFSRWQADQARAGWRILPDKVERELSAALDVDGEPFTVTGRIDRIDAHPDLGYRILDYKTGDQARTPDQQHRQGPIGDKHWTDLQLPLYQTLAATVGITGPHLALGYVLLPKDAQDVGLAQAPWTGPDLAQALDAAHAVIRGIREGIFWPPAEQGDEEFAGICMDRAIDRTSALALGPHGPTQGAQP